MGRGPSTRGWPLRKMTLPLASSSSDRGWYFTNHSSIHTGILVGLCAGSCVQWLCHV